MVLVQGWPQAVAFCSTLSITVDSGCSTFFFRSQLLYEMDSDSNSLFKSIIHGMEVMYFHADRWRLSLVNSDGDPSNACLPVELEPPSQCLPKVTLFQFGVRDNIVYTFRPICDSNMANYGLCKHWGWYGSTGQKKVTQVLLNTVSPRKLEFILLRQRK